MENVPRITLQRMVDVLGHAPKPAKVLQKQFDSFDGQLVEMAKWDWDKIPQDFLWYYILDLTYVELQPDLFRFAFPRCLKLWYDSLMDDQEAAHGEAEFHNALVKDNLRKMFSPLEWSALEIFFRDGLLDRIDTQTKLRRAGQVVTQERRPKDGWLRRFNSLGIICSISDIWEHWWKIDHRGKARCAILYASGLIYGGKDNILYGEFTPKVGGGGPYLTEDDASIFDHAWRPENLEYLSSHLSADYLLTKVSEAVNFLEGKDEIALGRDVENDIRREATLIDAKISILISELGKLTLEKEHWLDI